MYEIQFMPNFLHYLESDLRTIEVTKHEAESVWNSITSYSAHWKLVKVDGKTLKMVDFRRCKGCLTTLQFCHCEVHRGGAVLIDKGQLQRSEETNNWLANLQPKRVRGNYAATT